MLDQVERLAAAQPDKQSWRAFIAEWLVIAMIGVSAAQIYTLASIKEAIESHDAVTNRQIQLGDSTSLVIERALAHLEERQAGKSSQEYKLRTDQPELPRPLIETRPAAELLSDRPLP